jgi:uncharacterized protein (TIGR03000 family)
MKRPLFRAALPVLLLALVIAAPGQAAGIFHFTPADYMYGPYTGGHPYSYNVAYGYGLPFSAADTFRPILYANAGMYIPWPGNPNVPPPLASRWHSHDYESAPSEVILESAPSALPGSVLGLQPAVVGVHLPPDAELWFDTLKTTPTGSDRVFSSPPLESGKDFHYVLRARWNDNGKVAEQFQTVSVRAGQRVQVMFPKR